MIASILPLALLILFLSPGATSASEEVEALLETIEALQHPIHDFRCEYEGGVYFKKESAQEEHGLREDGLYDSFSGVFIRTAEGNLYCDSMHRIAPENTIVRRTLVVRMWEGQAERYRRKHDALLGGATIRDPEDVTSFRSGNYGKIFMVDELKRKATGDSFVASVSDEVRDGRPYKVLSVGMKGGAPDDLMFRFWVDLHRNGHVVRQEAYGGPEDALAGFIDVTLDSFPVGDEEVWMPVRGEALSFVAREDGESVYIEDPQIVETMYVVGGTMEFNQHPGREVFTIQYKPGTPISDDLRKMQYEYGQQQPPAKPTKAETEAQLRDALAKAEQQESRLVVASPEPGVAWMSWLPWGFGALALASATILWVQSRRR